MGWTATDEEEFPDELPVPEHAITLPEQRVEARVPPPDPDADLDAGSLWSDLADLSTPFVPVDTTRQTSALDRLRRRAARTGREIVDDPGAALSGLVGGGSFNTSDELAGVAGFLGSLGQPEGLPGSLPSDPVEAYTATRDMAREYDRDAEERSPGAHAFGEVAGTLLPAVATGGASIEAEAPTALGMIGQGARTGAAYGALSGWGGSDREGLDLAEDTAMSALAGGVTGGALAAVPAASRALRSRAPAAREAADLARVASVGGGSGTISREHPAIREFARLPGGISGQADRIRRLGLVGALESPESTAERSASVLERLLADGPMVETRRRLAEEGAEVPVDQIVRALGEHASDLESRAVRAPYAAPVRSLIDRFGDAYAQPLPSGVVGPPQLGTIPYETPLGTDARSALSELGDLSGTVPWHAETLAADTARGTRHAVREALDNWVEQQLGPDDLARYREGRLDYQTARVAADQARQRASRAAGNRGLSLTDVVAASGASTPMGALGRLLLNRVGGAFGPSGRATGREAIARLLGAMPEGTTSAELEQIIGRLSPDMATLVHDALSGAGEDAAATDPFAELGGVPDEPPAEGAPDATAPTTPTTPTAAAPDAPDPFAALGAVPDEEEEE